MSDRAANVHVDAYWEISELEPATACIACGGSSLWLKYGGLDDLAGAVPGVWSFKECDECGALNLHPRPVREQIAKAYPLDYETHTDGRSAFEADNGTGVFWALCNSYLNNRFGSQREPAKRGFGWLINIIQPIKLQLNYFYRDLPRRVGRVLDVGCGNGAFLYRAQAAGWQATGIEPDADAFEGARADGFKVLNSTIETFDAVEEFDYITLSHVFEHLHDPQAALERINGWLRPGGRLWMAMPNPAGLGAHLYRRNWFSLEPPRHLCLPKQGQVKRMLELAGFTDVKFKRRGRGAKSSISRSQLHAKCRRAFPARGGWLIALTVDLLASVHARFGDETVVVARRL